MLALTMALIDNDDDKELFRQMFNKYKKRIFSVAYHFLSSEALAEEATQGGGQGTRHISGSGEEACPVCPCPTQKTAGRRRP